MQPQSQLPKVSTRLRLDFFFENESLRSASVIKILGSASKSSVLFTLDEIYIIIHLIAKLAQIIFFYVNVKYIKLVLKCNFKKASFRLGFIFFPKIKVVSA